MFLFFFKMKVFTKEKRNKQANKQTLKYRVQMVVSGQNVGRGIGEIYKGD